MDDSHMASFAYSLTAVRIDITKLVLIPWHCKLIESTIV
jgi:hypothetical protein